MHWIVKNSAALAALTLLGSTAFAQTPPPPAPAHQGLFSRLFHPKPKPGLMPMRPGVAPSHSLLSGQFIGNKKSHIYHLPGDKGSLPSAQNRVYFPSAAAAEAAGYHAAGSGRGMTGHKMQH